MGSITGRQLLGANRPQVPPVGGALAAVGNTPLVRLTRLFPGLDFDLYAKLEALNPGGSAKDRAALGILQHALETRAVRPGGVVIESSSGNMGIGLAQACRCYGLRFICVIDPRTNEEKVQLLRAYGATVDLVTEPDAVTREFLQARLNRVQQLLAQYPGSFWPNQYGNLRNARAHQQTMREITEAVGGADYLFCATSTCGTIRGCAEYIRRHNLDTHVVAVDATGSVIFGRKRGKRLLTGHGSGIVPALYRPGLAERCVHVTDLDCVIGCRRLVRHEGILAGASSGAVVMALDRLRGSIPAGSTCVLILCDRGERYLATVYSDDWVRQNFGEVAELEQDLS